MLRCAVRSQSEFYNIIQYVTNALPVPGFLDTPRTPP